MNRIHQLPQIVERQLDGIKADADLLARIQSQKAQAKPSFDRFKRPAFALCAAAAVVCVTLAMPNFLSSAPPTGDNLLNSRSAGSSVEATVEPSISANVPTGAISLGLSTNGTGDTLFASGVDSNFPLISIGGATYRMLTTPTSISSNMLGALLGTISEFTLEPALGRSGLVSNVVPTGTEVYEVAGMPNALIAASIDGFVRVFQRVSYANTAIIGKETLSDTLCDASDVLWIALQDVGTLNDPAEVQAVMQTLLTKAAYASSSMTGNRSLQIGLHNGLTLQMLVGDDTVSACGTWNAPDFFDAFEEAMGL